MADEPIIPPAPLAAPDPATASEIAEPPLRMQRRSFLIVFVALGALLAFGFMRPFTTSLVFASVFTVLLWPVNEWFLARTRGHAAVSATLTVLTAHLTVLLPFTVVSVFAIRQFADIAQSDILSTVELETHLIRLEALIHDTFGTDIDIIGVIVSQWQKIAAESTKLISTLLGGLALVFFQYVIAVVFVFYLLVRGRELIDIIVELSPLGSQVNRRILNRFGDTSRAVLWGTLVTITAQGFVATIGLVLGGVENAILWGVMMTFCAMIPVFGTALVWGPFAILAFTSGDTLSATVIVVFGAIASVVDNIIRPIIVGNATTVPTLWILLSILGGIATLGPVGVILGPALLAVFRECIDIYREEFLGHPAKEPRKGPRFRDIPFDSVPGAKRPELNVKASEPPMAAGTGI